MDPVVTRVLMVVLIFAGVGVVAYIVAWIVIPEAGEGEPERPADAQTRHGTAVALGAGLIGLGGLLLLRGMVPWFYSDMFWPVLVVVGGALSWSRPAMITTETETEPVAGRAGEPPILRMNRVVSAYWRFRWVGRAVHRGSQSVAAGILRYQRPGLIGQCSGRSSLMSGPFAPYERVPGLERLGL